MDSQFEDVTERRWVLIGGSGSLKWALEEGILTPDSVFSFCLLSGWDEMGSFPLQRHSTRLLSLIQQGAR